MKLNPLRQPIPYPQHQQKTMMRLAKFRNGTGVEPKKPRRRRQKRQNISLAKKPEELAKRLKRPQILWPSRMTNFGKTMDEHATMRTFRHLGRRRARENSSIGRSNYPMSSATKRWSMRYRL